MIAIARPVPPNLAPYPALLAGLHAACFAEEWSTDAVTALLAMPGAFVGVAEQAGEPVGFHLSRTAADEAEIISIGVRPDARRAGIGAALLVDAMDRARAAGSAALFVEVAADNAAAIALYRRTGFAQVGRRAGYYATPAGAQDALVLRASLIAVSADE